jgi:HSP20 family protein
VVCLSNRGWDPLGDLLSLQERMNRLFDAHVGRFALECDGTGGPWQPQLDVCETEDAFVVLVDVPGLQEADTSVRVDGDTLTLRGERRPATGAQRPERFFQMERTQGPFVRTLSFAEPVDGGRVVGRLEDGVWTIDVPKLGHARPARGRGDRSG